MPYLARWTIVLALALGACAPHGTTAAGSVPRPRVNRRTDLITADEIDRKHWTNMYEMISELHANWLHDRGPDNFGEPGVLQVQMDNMRLGDVTTLRSIPVIDILSVQYFDPITASARWGLGYGHGAILISTRTR